MCVHEEDFILEPNVVRKFSFSFPSLPGSVGSSIEVSQSLHIHIHSVYCTYVGSGLHIYIIMLVSA